MCFFFFACSARKIHISEATKEILENLGGFTIEERGEIFLKVRQKTFFLSIELYTTSKTDLSVVQCDVREFQLKREQLIGNGVRLCKFSFCFNFVFLLCKGKGKRQHVLVD